MDVKLINVATKKKQTNNIFIFFHHNERKGNPKVKIGVGPTRRSDGRESPII